MAKTEPTAQLAVIDDPAAMAAVLAGLREMEVTDTSEFNAAQIHNILLAETEEEAFAEVATYNAEDMENIPFTVNIAKLLPSTFNDGKGAFVAADIVRHDTGEKCILTTSAARPAARICWLQLHEKLPRDVKITVITEKTGNGYKLYGLEIVG